MRVFGIAGKKQVGKDTTADNIAKLLSDMRVKKLSFAKPLKDFVEVAFSIPKRHLWGSDSQKNYPLCTWGEIFTSGALERYTKESHALLTAREILQVVGTDVMRQGNLDFLQPPFAGACRAFVEEKFGAGHKPYNELWVDLMVMEVKVLAARNEAEVVAIPDVRFLNEVEGIRKMAGTPIRLYRDTGAKDSIPHASELELDQMSDSLFDYVLYEHENRNLGELKSFAVKVLQSEGLLPVGGFGV